MIYIVNRFNNIPLFYVDQITYDNNPNYKSADLLVGTKEDAMIKLIEVQNQTIQQEAVRFSICSTFIDGCNTIWREVHDSDPEETICQVFDTYTGTYTQCKNKTEAIALNEKKKQDFLASIGLDSIQEVAELPSQPRSSLYAEQVFGTTLGNIPVEVM